MPNRLILMPEYPAPIDDAWRPHLPVSIIIEADNDHSGPLEAQLTYPHLHDIDKRSLPVTSWELTYDARNGRILKIAFPGRREEEIFDELRAALMTIKIFAEFPTSEKLYHFGLKIAATCLVAYFDSAEAKLRAAMRTPFTPST